MSADILAVVRKLQAETKKLRLEKANRRAAGNYRLDRDDIADLARAYHLIDSAGDKERGMRLLAEVLDDLEPRWREWA